MTETDKTKKEYWLGLINNEGKTDEAAGADWRTFWAGQKELLKLPIAKEVWMEVAQDVEAVETLLIDPKENGSDVTASDYPFLKDIITPVFKRNPGIIGYFLEEAKEKNITLPVKLEDFMEPNVLLELSKDKENIRFLLEQATSYIKAHKDEAWARECVNNVVQNSLYFNLTENRKDIESVLGRSVEKEIKEKMLEYAKDKENGMGIIYFLDKDKNDEHDKFLIENPDKEFSKNCVRSVMENTNKYFTLFEKKGIFESILGKDEANKILDKKIIEFSNSWENRTKEGNKWPEAGEEGFLLGGGAKNDCVHGMLDIMNRLHEDENHQPGDPAIRFQIIKYAKSQELYELISDNSWAHDGNSFFMQEIYPSTYKYIFEHLQTQLKAENKSLFDYIKDDKNFIFFEKASHFGHLDDAVKMLTPDEQHKVFDNLLQNLYDKKDSQAISLLNDFTTNVTDANLKQYIEKTFKERYEASPDNSLQKDLLGFAARSCAETQKSTSGFFSEIAKEHRYDLPENKGKTIDQLTDKNDKGKRRCVEVNLFYDEGNSVSCDNFMAMYKNKPGWDVKDEGDFYVIKSKPGNGTTEMIIYASKLMPSSHDKDKEDKTETTMDGINKNIEALHPPGEVKVFAVRGHIYDMQRGMEQAPKTVQVLQMGGCNGYNFVYGCIDKAPESDFIGTKGIGVGVINNKLSNGINKRIMNGENLNYDDLFHDLDKIDDPRKNYYVNPHSDNIQKVNLQLHRLHPEISLGANLRQEAFNDLASINMSNIRVNNGVTQNYNYGTLPDNIIGRSG